MARARNMTGRGGPSDVGVAWIWDLEFAVGPGCYNRPDDVQLVQHAINKLSAHFDLRMPDGSIVGYLKRDGLFGPKTATAIVSYQQARKDKRRLITVDGQVGPSSATGWNKKGDAQYTIVYLNRDHRAIYGEMMDEKDFPDPLQTKARHNRTVQG